MQFIIQLIVFSSHQIGSAATTTFVFIFTLFSYGWQYLFKCLNQTSDFFLQKNEIKLKAMTDSDMLTSAGFYAHYYLINWFVRINLVGYKATNTNKKIYIYEIQQTSISLNTYSLSHSSKVFSGEHKWMSRERCQQKEKKTYSIIYLVKFYFTVENGPSVVINDIIQKSAIRKSIRKNVCECVCKSQNGAKSLKRTKHKHINTQSVCMKNFVYT